MLPRYPKDSPLYSRPQQTTPRAPCGILGHPTDLPVYPKGLSRPPRYPRPHWNTFRTPQCPRCDASAQSSNLQEPPSVLQEILQCSHSSPVCSRGVLVILEASQSHTLCSRALSQLLRVPSGAPAASHCSP